jgi:hypothetical protein
MPRHKYVVDEAAFTALLALDDGEIARLLCAIENLAENPTIMPDYYSLDGRGRKLASKIAGSFLVTYWNDFETRTLYILRVDYLDA